MRDDGVRGCNRMRFGEFGEIGFEGGEGYGESAYGSGGSIKSKALQGCCCFGR